MGERGLSEPSAATGYARWLQLRVRDGIACMTRTATAFDSLEQLRAAYEAFVADLEALEVACLLTDLRVAPGRNDPDFEQVIAPLRKRMYAAFERRAVVVGSEIGRLHVARHARTDGYDVGVFLDIDEAVAWLGAASSS